MIMLFGIKLKNGIATTKIRCEYILNGKEKSSTEQPH